MSNLEDTPEQELRLLTMAKDHDCSYLSGQSANSVFLDPNTPPSWYQYSQLSRVGFRRSGTHFYRPRCSHCDACKSCRILSEQLDLASKRFKRILKKASSFKASIVPAKYSLEHYSLYESYINLRHKDGDMHPATQEQYRNFLISDYEFSYFLEIRDDQNQLIAATAVDLLDDGFSAIYTYFDVDYEKYSLGTLVVLLLTRLTRERELPYVYLGYWVQNSPKMNYKAQFKPLEILDKEIWQALPQES